MSDDGRITLAEAARLVGETEDEVLATVLKMELFRVKIQDVIYVLRDEIAKAYEICTEADAPEETPNKPVKRGPGRPRKQTKE